jgi:tetraacyldisaccharide 4'-kinase
MRERLRAWTERLETFGREVIIEERRGTRETLLRGLLHACSRGYQLAIDIRRFLYNFRILRDSTLGVQVIAVGNLTWGGTGKTPVVEKFARELRDQGRNVGAALRAPGQQSAPSARHHPSAGRIRREVPIAGF